MDTAAIWVAAATQTGALIYFAGMVSRTLKDHDRRHEETERRTIKLVRDVAELKALGGAYPHEHWNRD